MIVIHLDQPSMFGVGMVKPVYMTIARIRIAAGASACVSDREVAAIVLNTIDMVRVRKNEISTKKKNAPGSRLRFVIK